MPTLMPSPRRSRRAARLTATALIAVALPIAGCGGSSGGDHGSGGDFDPATLVPASAAVYGEATVRPEGDQKATIETLAEKIGKTDDPAAKLIAALDKSLKKDGATYKDDIEPWLGKKAAVTVTGLKDPQTPDLAVIVAATDSGKALAAVKKLQKHAVDRQYKGVSYSFDSGQDMAAAAVGDSLTVATEGAMKTIIDVDKGAASLAKSDKLAKARKNVSADPLAFLYVDPAGLIDLIAASIPAFGGQVGQIKGLLGNSKVFSVGAALTAAEDAVRLETAVDGQASSGGTGDAAQTVAGLPAGSVLAAGFGDIGSRAQQAVKQLGQLGGMYTSVLSQFKTITGLDLQQDVLSWMGKGGLFVRAKGVADIGGALVVDTKDPQKTAAFIAAVRRLVDQFGTSSGVQVMPFSGGGAKGFQVQTGGQVPFPIIVATGGGKFVIAAGQPSVAEALNPTTKLSDDGQFKATKAQLGVDPAFYLDFKSIVGFASLAAGSNPGFQSAKPYLDAFTAVAAGSQHSGSVTKTNFVVGVK